MRRTKSQENLSPLSSSDSIILLYTDVSALLRDHHAYNMPATKQNPPASPSQTTIHENDKLEAIKKLIESKFSQTEERISFVKQQIESQNVVLLV